MNLKSQKKERAETKPISLFPTHIKFADERKKILGIGLSGYVQKLIEYDQANNVMGKILAEQALKAA